jgi:hypothetical protein
MKNLALIVFFMCALFSCKKNDKLDSEQYPEFDIKQFPQTWQLVKMTSSMSNIVVTGADLAWKESYLLNSDGTFTKSREYDGKQTKASGTFAFKEQKTDGKYLELTYESDNNLIESCFLGQTETLRLETDNYIVGGSAACDGPGLEYRRTQ